MLLGGRAAEHVILGKVSTGASNDLERATDLARRMVCEFGMSQAIGPVAYARRQPRFLDGTGAGTPAASEATAREIEEEIQRLVEHAFERACEIVQRRREGLIRVARHLLEHEVIDGEELERILEDAPRAA